MIIFSLSVFDIKYSQPPSTLVSSLIDGEVYFLLLVKLLSGTKPEIIVRFWGQPRKGKWLSKKLCAYPLHGVDWLHNKILKQGR